MNPHVALLIAQVIGSLNSVISRAAFVISPESDPLTTSVPTPLTFAVWRATIASCVLTILRYFIVKRPVTSINNSSTTNVDNNNNNSNKEAHDFFNDKSKEKRGAPSSVSTDYYSLSTPFHHPSVKMILQVVALGGIVITGNFTLFFFGVAFTDAITLASMMCLIPPICFVLGYLMGMESFTIPKLLSTLLVVCGNFVMAHGWRIMFPTSSSSSSSFSSVHASSGRLIDESDEKIHHPHAHAHAHAHAHHADQQHVLLHQQLNQQAAAHGGGNHSSNYFLGLLSLFMAFVFWCLYLLLQRELVKKMHLIDFLFYLYWSALAGLLTITMFHPDGDAVFRQVFENQLSSFSWSAILYAGCIQSVGTYFLVAYATAKADSSLLAALYNGLMPLFVTVEAIILLGETMDGWQVIGGAIVVCGWCGAMIAISKDNNNNNNAESSTTLIQDNSNNQNGSIFESISNLSPMTAMLLQKIPFFANPTLASSSRSPTSPNTQTPKDRVV